MEIRETQATLPLKILQVGEAVDESTGELLPLFSTLVTKNQTAVTFKGMELAVGKVYRVRCSANDKKLFIPSKREGTSRKPINADELPDVFLLRISVWEDKPTSSESPPDTVDPFE